MNQLKLSANTPILTLKDEVKNKAKTILGLRNSLGKHDSYAAIFRVFSGKAGKLSF